MDGLWDRLNLFAILRSELMKNGFRDDQRLIGQLNQLKLIGLRIVHADVDEGKTGLSHCFAQGRHMFDVRVQEHRIFQLERFRVRDDLPGNDFPLEISNDRQGTELRAEIFGDKMVDAASHLAQRCS